MVVKDCQSPHAQSRNGILEINGYRTLRYGNSPEHIICVYVGIVIVNLLSEVSRSNWTGVNVQSNKRERALVVLAVPFEREQAGLYVPPLSLWTASQ